MGRKLVKNAPDVHTRPFSSKNFKESPESKIVFSIDSACLIIESVSKDSDPILELQSLIKDSLVEFQRLISSCSTAGW